MRLECGLAKSAASPQRQCMSLEAIFSSRNGYNERYKAGDESCGTLRWAYDIELGRCGIYFPSRQSRKLAPTLRTNLLATPPSYHATVDKTSPAVNSPAFGQQSRAPSPG
jgi:hypothetical protein